MSIQIASSTVDFLSALCYTAARRQRVGFAPTVGGIMFDEISKLVQRRVETLNTVEELKQLETALSAIGRPARLKIIEIKKVAEKARRDAREAEALKLCEALRTGDKVTMQEHGYLGFFGGGPDRFYKPNAVVSCYQPRKKILWLDVQVTVGNHATLERRAFSLGQVASYNVRRTVL
ncbi:MAG TPA: hypothetical protein VIY29_09630 [Ktedonobacteraceae bacterium]